MVTIVGTKGSERCVDEDERVNVATVPGGDGTGTATRGTGWTCSRVRVHGSARSGRTIV